MKSYQYILLDWDGNLAQTLHIWLDATHAPLSRRGLDVSDELVVKHCFGRPIEGFAELGVTDVDVAIEEMNVRANELLPDVELYPDALYTLEALQKKGKKTALITTSLRENVMPALDKYDVHQFFDVVITNEDTTHHKPHPEPLERALVLLGGNAEEAIMIGDSDKDIDAATNANMDSILFFPDEHKKFYRIEELQDLEPTHVVENFREVISIVN